MHKGKTMTRKDNKERKPIWTARFVVHEHHAKRAGLHYDLRLEVPKRKILWSFASRHKLPLKAGIRRLLIRQEDHDPYWLDFEGEIPPGEYGAGTLKIWDKGEYTLWSRKNNKVFVVEFKGKRLKGKYALVHTSGDNYLLLKMTDKGE